MNNEQDDGLESCVLKSEFWNGEEKEREKRSSVEQP